MVKQYSGLVILGLVVVAIRILDGVLKGGSSTGSGSRGGPFKVEAKPFFFSRAENAFYGVLTEACEPLGLLAFPKVGLNDLFRDMAGAANGQYHRYAQMHVDYLLVTNREYRPVAGIELDGPSHQAQQQQQRDSKKNDVFQAADLPLLRFKNGGGDTPQELESLLRAAVGRY